MVDMTMTSITAGTTVAATAIAGHIKHGRGTPKAGLYLYFACLYDHYYYCATRATKTNSTVQQQVAKPARACLKPIQPEDQSINSLSLVRQSRLPHPPLPHWRHWDSQWIWRNLCSAHLRH